MVKSLFSKASLFCLFALFFVMKSEAEPVVKTWSCDQEGRYEIMDETFLTQIAAEYGTPYFFYLPQNIAAGEVVAAHFKTRSVSKVSNVYTVTANVKDEHGTPVATQSVQCLQKSTDWSGDNAFIVPSNATGVQFTFQTGSWTAKQTKFWIPMPVHLDVRDLETPGFTELGQSELINIPLHTFFLQENTSNINIELIDDELNAGDFQIVKGTLTPTRRCGHFGGLGVTFYNTSDIHNQFIVRFTPTAGGERSAKFRIYNGAQEKIITVTSTCVLPRAHFHAVGDGIVTLYVNDEETPITESPYEFIPGDKVKFVATPNKGSHFVDWNLNPFLRDTVIEFTADKSFSIWANFKANIYKVCVIPSDPSKGRVSIATACHHACKPFRCGFHHHHPRCPQTCADMPYGAKVKLEAIPAPGYMFMGWTGCESDSIISLDPIAFVEVGEETCFMANFAKAEEVFHIVAEAQNGVGVVINSFYDDVDEDRFYEVPATLYSINGAGWEEYVAGDTISVNKKNDIIYLRAKTTNETFRGLRYRTDPDTLVPAIHISDSASVVGNIMYLLDNNAATTTLNLRAFTSLFAGDKIVYADRLQLPVEELGHSCYNGMFRGCKTLKTAPVLASTHLADMCYNYMFTDCESLIETPVLSADSIPYKAYEAMFLNCVTLTSAPDLNFTKLGGTHACHQMFEGCVNIANNFPTILAPMTLTRCCYYAMFKGCVLLEKAPVLPATELVELCYQEMFYDCVNLNRIEVAFTDWGEKNKFYTKNWTVNVAHDGTFVCPTELPEVRNNGSKHNIPQYWDINVAEVNFSVNDPNMGSIYAEYTQGNIPIMSGDQIDFGKEVRFTATAEDGFVFDHFEDGKGNFIIAENPFAIVINEDRTIVAVFTEIQTAPGAPVNSENASYIAVAEGMNIVIKGADDAKVCVYDAAGRLVEAIDNAANFETINVEIPGVYFVYVPGQFTTRVIVK